MNLIVLPKGLDLGLRLEIFRRINEAGVPLSPHDLRLATFGRSEKVYFIRLAGVFDPDREGATRMIQAGKQNYGLDYPWQQHSYWKDWWEETAQSTEQAASQTFLYYVIARDLTAVETILNSSQLQQSLGLHYDRTTTSVLDLFCAQMQSEKIQGTAKITADLLKLAGWFKEFETWFNTIKGQKVPRVSLNSATKVAFFIAGACQLWKAPNAVTEPQWEKIQLFLTKGPAEIQDKLQVEFSPTRGKWPGQKKQIEQTFAICKKITT